jgi:hypothetical protein
MDFDISSCSDSNTTAAICGSPAKDIDAAAVFLDTLMAFDEMDRLENLAANEESFLPSLENILAFSSYIKEKIDFILTFHGILSEPAFTVDLNEKNGKLIFQSDRKDISKIAKFIKQDSETVDGLITLLTIASQTYQLLESIDGDCSFPQFKETGRVVYMYGEGYFSLYKED